MTFALGHGATKVGRSSRRCDVVLPLPDISREHAVITPRGQRAEIEDISRHGIAVNGKRVKRSLLVPGDVVRIGAYSLRIETDAAGHTGQRSLETENLTTVELALPTSTERFGEMVGASESMQEVYEDVRQLACSPSPVLILGETGTGKELVARALHSLGSNPGEPWVPVNCAAIAPELAESELFGHEKGAFSGAHRMHRGAFEHAGAGTLFLDEIGEMPLRLQPKLLRVLEDRQVLRVGGRQPIPVSARVIAASNRDLARDAAAKRFRSDLYYRLCVVPVHLPPLRERGEDVLLLANHFIAEQGAAGRIEFTQDARELLVSHPWPGNVRELRNAIQRLLAKRRQGAVDSRALRAALEADRVTREAPLPRASISQAGGAKKIPTGGESEERPYNLKKVERLAILRALQDCNWNKQAAVRRLGIASATLYQKLRLYDLRKQ